MLQALRLARKGAGRVSPNPMVGCVIARGGRVLAEGWHKRFGGDHAEIEALQKLRGRAARATLYVTMEPCHHFGKTPPCVDAVIASGVIRVVIAMRDPNPLTSGKSVRKLRAAGIAVTLGVRRREARELNRFFVKHVTTGTPYVIAKVARSRDGMISTRKDAQGWITGEKAGRYVQGLRGVVDSVLIGRATASIDDPRLNVRAANKPQPRRVILDSKLRVNPSARVFSSPGGRVILFCSKTVSLSRVLKFERLGVEVIPVRFGKGGLDLRAVLRELGARGIASVLVEGGAKIFTSFARTNLADEWQIITAPFPVGKGGTPAFENGLEPAFVIRSSTKLGRDELAVGAIRP